jgi:hypothetical protein
MQERRTLEKSAGCSCAFDVPGVDKVSRGKKVVGFWKGLITL